MNEPRGITDLVRRMEDGVDVLGPGSGLEGQDHDRAAEETYLSGDASIPQDVRQALESAKDRFPIERFRHRRISDLAMRRHPIARDSGRSRCDADRARGDED